jgi:hypothetical protein
LAGSLGALVAYLAQALGRPLPIRAANGDPVTAGDTVTATNTTEVTTNSGHGLQGTSSDGVASGVYGQNDGGGYGVAGRSTSGGAVLGESTSGEGVRGTSSSSTGVHGLSTSGTGILGDSGSWIGVWGSSSSGTGVYASSTSGTGVLGTSGSGVGIAGYSSATDQPASLGRSSGNSTGVQGFSGGPGLYPTPAAPAKTGVYGYANQDGTAVGVAGDSVNGIGVKGESTGGSGVLGSSSLGVGVEGQSDTAAGVDGFSASGFGIAGASNSTDYAAIRGWSNGNHTGVFGVSGSPAIVTPAKTGVYGYAAQDANARGVTGRSTAGRGLNGQATTGRGVHGQATSGTGVYATATTGTALRAVGPVRFSSAGLATIPSGSKSVTVNPGLDITGASKVLALPQTNPGGTTTIQRIARNTVANTFTIYLTANAAANTIVAWFLIS